jgi:Zn-dependent protease with chaperone function
MDFFEAQSRAQKRTGRLILLFVGAVLGTIAAGYFAAILILRQIAPFAERAQAEYWNYQNAGVWQSSPPGTTWWDPRILAVVALGTVTVVGAASLYKWYQFKAGGEAVADSVGGIPVDPNTTDLNERRLLNVVEEMAIASGTPVPTVYLLPDEAAINAFAAGLTTNDAVVAVSRGAMEKLTRDELQGVIGHEFSHILNGDMRMNLRIASIVFGILVIGLLGRGIFWSMRRVRSSRGRGSGRAVAVTALIGIALMLIGYVGYFFGRILQAAVSRQREFLADASAVQFTRNPAGIAGALKKIGGYALGGLMNSSKATTIGHFFFAQAFRTGVTGLWATHPPLPERIRAIEPGFDGKMFIPPQMVDVRTETFQAAGFHGGRRLSADATTERVFSVPAAVPAARPVQKIAFNPARAVASIGQFSQDSLERARRLLGDLPESLQAAARTPADACAVIYGLMLDADPGIRARQRELIAQRAGPAALARMTALDAELQSLGPEQKLPLLQLTLPALRQLPATDLPAFLDTLDELVHADARVSTFEFALQKLLLRTLHFGHEPRAPVIQYHSSAALTEEFSVLLSAMARAAVRDPSLAPQAFAVGAAQLRLVEDRLRFRANSDMAALDASLEKLAAASPALKQQALGAAAHVVGADGQTLVAELELLRAVAAALDCPMPPTLASA